MHLHIHLFYIYLISVLTSAASLETAGFEDGES